MKKIITLLAVVAFVVSCSQSRKWTDKEREEVRKTLRDYRDRSAIRHMEAANYGNLEQCVLTTIEGTYPDYNKYDQLTAKEDTLNAAMVSCVGFSIGDNFENLPLLFPAAELQGERIAEHPICQPASSMPTRTSSPLPIAQWVCSPIVTEARRTRWIRIRIICRY